MENYQVACDARLQDVEVLLGMPVPRCVAASHLGGAAAECRLKALIVRYHRISEWNNHSVRPKDPRMNSPIPNPGHSLLLAMRLMPDLYHRARLDKQFLRHLARVMHPSGATTADFVALRYRGLQLPAQTLGEWRSSFRYVMGWLQKNEAIV